MQRGKWIGLLTLIMIIFAGCTHTGSSMMNSTPPPWITRDPVMPGFYFAIGMQDGGENAGELAAQHAREELSKSLQPQILDWMESYVIEQAGLINEDQSFYLKQQLPTMLDMIMLRTQIEDRYVQGNKHWVLLKLNQDLAHRVVQERMEQDKTLQQKLKAS